MVAVIMTPSTAQRVSHRPYRVASPRRARLGRLAATAVVPALWSLSACSTSPGGDGALTGGAATDAPAASGGAVGSGGVGVGGEPNVGSGGASGGALSTGGVGSGGDVATGGVASGGGAGSGSGGMGSGGDGSGGDGGDPLSAGCGKPFQSPPPKNEQQEVQIQGDSRYYLMDVPAGADNSEPLMLVFGLHGYDMNNIAVVDLFNFTERSNGKAITVWPQGEGPHPGNTSHWGDEVLKSTWTPNSKNFEFLQTIVDDLGERYCIDRERIFIAGFSMGGFFTNAIACEHPEWFRGFAPVAGGGPQGCTTDTPVAIMVQHGTVDPIVDIESGEGSRDFWLDTNGCGQGSTKSLNNCDFYQGCPDEAPVAWCTGNYDHYIPNEVASNAWSFFSSL